MKSLRCPLVGNGSLKLFLTFNLQGLLGRVSLKIHFNLHLSHHSNDIANYCQLISAWLTLEKSFVLPRTDPNGDRVQAKVPSLAPSANQDVS